MDKMKIAIIGSKGLPAKYGGTQKVVENLSIEFVKKKCIVTIFGKAHYCNKHSSYIFKGIKVNPIKGINTKRFDTVSYCFISAIKAGLGECEIIAFHGYVPGLFAVITKLFGKKNVLHLHGIMNILKPRGKINIFDNIIIRFLIVITKWAIDDISIVADSQQLFAEKIYGRKVKVIPNGFNNINEIKSENREHYFLFVGRIVEGKGIEYLIRAFKKIHNVYPKYSLIIAGGNIHSRKYFVFLNQLASDINSIKFVGFKEGKELVELYKKAFCVIIPSEFEASPMVLLEALAYNGVVICSDVEPFINAKDYLILFKTKDSESLFNKINNLICDEDMYKELYLKSEKYPFNEFSWDSISNEYLDFYRKILNEGK